MGTAKLSGKCPVCRLNSHWPKVSHSPHVAKEAEDRVLPQSELCFLNKTENIVTKQLTVPAT